MDHPLELQGGFTKEQLQGFDFDALLTQYQKRFKKASMLESGIDGAKTLNASSKEKSVVSVVEKPRAHHKDVEPAGSLREEQQVAATVAPSPLAQGNQLAPIAIVGMSCRFPGGVSNLEEFWNLISEGRSAWSKVPESRFNADAFYNKNSDRTDSMNVNSGHFLQGTDYAHFDTSFFNISPNEAKAMDPRARMHLEGAYEALENAGITLAELKGSDTAVFVGAFHNDYSNIMLRDPGILPAYKATGLGVSLFSNRISHWFDLRGPSLTLDTACSASMTALHMACNCLRSGESKMAIVSGANLILDPDPMMSLSTMKFLSPDGRTYMFDQRANGYSRGEGVGTLIIKPLAAALQANDPIHAVIRNTRMNQDGRTPGITMPSQEAQRSLIQATYQEAGLDPAETGFFEAHGTGTQAGDRVEAEALSSALSTTSRAIQDLLHVGSVKTLIGHTEGCSGVAGVMHAAMALRNKTILPNCNFEIPNDQIDFDLWKIKVPTRLETWHTNNPRRASVNSFGYGGSNVHVILEEPPVHAGDRLNSNGTAYSSDSHSIQAPKLLCLSANDSDGIERQARLLVGYLRTHQRDRIDDLVYTLGQRRSIHKYRYAVQSDSIEGFRINLDTLKYKPPKASGPKRLAFMFTGQGAQWPRMGCQLLAAYPVFKNAFLAADKHMSSLGASWSLLDELCREAAESKVDEAFISQPLCTALQIALVNLLHSWGIQPRMVVGHSSGEIAAAYTAGMLSLESAITVAYYRGKLSSELSPKNGSPKGGMLAAGLSAEDVQVYIESLTSGKATIACINSPKSVTLSGDASAIDELHFKLEEKGLFSRKLKVNVAYHSSHMTAIASDYSRSLRDLNVQMRHQEVEFYSSVFPGIPVETNAEYWVQNLLSPVRFSAAIRFLFKPMTEYDLGCIEIGPHSALAGPFKQICQSLSAEAKVQYFPSILRNGNGIEHALNLACSLYNNGWTINPASINFPLGKTGLRVLTDLPPYAWNHSTQHWQEGRLSRNYLRRDDSPHDLLGTLSNDSSDLDMRWSSYIRRSELPWLKDHQVKSEIVLPGSAYLAMAMEAIKRKIAISGLQVQGYTLRDVTFSKALLVPNTSDGVEVSLILEPLRQSSVASSTNWHEFRVISFGTDRKASEHCHGLISATHDPSFNLSSRDETELAMMHHDKAMQPDFHKRFLSQGASGGISLGPSFQLVPRSCLKGGHVFSTIRIPDRFGNESHLPVSAPLLDSILQVSAMALTDTGRLTEGSVIPTSIAELAISVSISQNPGYEFQARGSTAELSPRDFEGHVTVIQDENGIMEPVAQMTGAKFVSISKGEESSKSNDTKPKLYWNLVWEDDSDDLSQDVAKSWGIHEPAPDLSEIVVRERAIWYCIRSAYEFLADKEIEEMAPHHQKYYSWMKKRYELGQSGNLSFQKGREQEWSSTDQHTVENTLQQVADASTAGCMAVRLGRRLLDILRGEVEPLSLMLEDDLLNRFYAGVQGQDRVYEQAAQFVRLAAHKNPKLRILEIGAGTGGATSWILKVLGGYDKNYSQFSSYVFTDISSGFFEKARLKFDAWGSLISYKTLNIEEDLKAQGFDEDDKYDIIVAANVLHATHAMNHTMSQVNKLLETGGRLLLVEITSSRQLLSPFSFGTLPGWWMATDEGRTDSPLLSEGQWASLLKRTGYSGLDICLRDSLDDELWAMSMMVSTKQDSSAKIDSSGIRIIHDTQQEQDFVKVLATDLERLTSAKPMISTLSGLDTFESLVVIVDHASGSLLLDIDERKLEILKAIFAQAKGVLWVVFGSSGNCENVGAGAVSGFLGSLRSENAGVNYFMCNIETGDSSRSELARAVTNIYAKAFSISNTTSSMKDFEYAVRNGRIMIPRLVEDKLANQAITRRASNCEPKEEPLWQEDSCLCLDMGQVGLLDTFRFVHSERCSDEIPHDQVEIEVKAAGLNFRDLMVATGQLADPDGFGVECAGVITKIGSATHSLKVGDRVCATAPFSFAGRTRAPQDLVGIIPDSMSFETGASIPGIFTTAYHCIHHAARLQKNESILIHSAAGGTGQACIKLAQLVGAQIFVTAGSPAKVDFLQKTFAIPRNHILNSRSLKFGREIMSLTEGKGVDVIINSLAGDALRESWRCLAMFGRFIELGKRDAVENTRLEMAPFLKSASFIAVALNLFSTHRPEFVGTVFKDIMTLFARGTLTPVEPITTYSMSAIEPAFRYMASGNHMGKIVITADRDCLVKTVPRSPPPFKLHTQASYLLVGGMGGIGLEIAKWMVNELDAKSIILISRSGMDASGAAESVEALGRSGAVITVRKCDVADKTALSAVLHDCSQSLPPIRGVVQGAMVLKDSIFPNMTLNNYHAALKPKIRGSQNLHELFQQSLEQLDFFVMLSSVCGLLGNLSQSNYAAGNTFQDALAHHRASLGLPALTIDVGKVVDVGWVSQNMDFINRGFMENATNITTKDLTALIEYHVRTRVTDTDKIPAQVAVGILKGPASDARFLHVDASLMTTSKNQESQNQTQSLESEIAAAGHDFMKVSSVILEAFKQKLGRLLALKVEDVHDDDTIMKHGVDSLVAVEIRNWLRKEVGANVTVFEILNGKVSIREMVDSIARETMKA